jgi:hypothetical protein
MVDINVERDTRIAAKMNALDKRKENENKCSRRVRIEKEGIRLLNARIIESKDALAPEQYQTTTVQTNYSFKNPSPSYKLTGVAHVTPIPSPLLVGVVIPRRTDVGVGGAR